MSTEIAERHGVSSSTFLSAILAAAASFLTVSAAFAANVTLTTLDGASAGGGAVTIDELGRVTLRPAADPKGAAREFELQALKQIAQPAVKPAPGDAPIEVMPAGGGRLAARAVRIENGFLVAEWAYGKDARAPLSAVRALRFLPPKGSKPPESAELFDAAVRQPDSAQDTVFVLKQNKVVQAAGAVTGIDEKQIGFRLGDEDIAVPRAKIYGVVFAASAPPPDLLGMCLARLADGSEIWGRAQSLQDGQLLLKACFEEPAKLPWSAIAALDVRSDRLLYLSDADPCGVIEVPMFNVKWGYQRDKSAGGGPIALAKTKYDKGLGVHSRCELTYDLKGRFKTLLGTIGIDDEVKGHGDCVFRVTADGKKVFEQRMTGKDKPMPISVPILGAQKVTLAVDFGEDLDLGDHADWADCRAIK